MQALPPATHSVIFKYHFDYHDFYILQSKTSCKANASNWTKTMNIKTNPVTNYVMMCKSQVLIITCKTIALTLIIYFVIWCNEAGGSVMWQIRSSCPIYT